MNKETVPKFVNLFYYGSPTSTPTEAGCSGPPLLIFELLHQVCCANVHKFNFLCCE